MINKVCRLIGTITLAVVILFTNVCGMKVYAKEYEQVKVGDVIQVPQPTSYLFIPEKSGMYKIYSTGDVDSSITVYKYVNENEETFCAGEDDIDDNNLNFSLTFYFEKGEKYILMASNYYFEEALYEMHIEFDEQAKNIESVEVALKDDYEPIMRHDTTKGVTDPLGIYHVNSDIIKNIFNLTVKYDDQSVYNWDVNRDGMEVDGYLIDASYVENSDGYFLKVVYVGRTIMVPMPMKEATAVEINGFQISPEHEGFRTVYSVGNAYSKCEINEVGLIYGLKDSSNPEELVIDSNNNNVYAVSATDNGILSGSVSTLPSSTSYAMTMRYGKMNELYFTAEHYVRAYAKVTETKSTNYIDTIQVTYYIYSDVADYNIYSVADKVYKNNYMSTQTAHDYLYDNILCKVNVNYEQVDFVNGNYSIVNQ